MSRTFSIRCRDTNPRISNMSRLPLPLDQTPAHRKIFKGFLPFGKIWNQFWQLIYSFGQNFVVVNIEK